ncbi:MAG: hypothetical protein EXQ55_02205 [Acidobacteria bacterium]|nr:hypothetical protein [Acidobacteriota bacterium]
MRGVFAQRKAQVIAALAIALALVGARSIVWVFFEQSHFDSDQAIVGLMAKHLAEGRAFPLFFYGQHYMLAVESWLAAPVFRVAGASIAALKLPLLGLNLVTCALLLWVLVRKMGLAPFEALVISIFFIVPPPLVSARLVEAQGSNIEPFLYVLVLWLLRRRPIAFGLVAGFAFLHREFAAYAIAAIVLLDVLTRRAFTRERLREYVMSWGMFALVNVVVSLLKMKADLLGPGTAGTLNLGGLDAQVSSWGGFVCWTPSELGVNLRWLRQENLGMLFNYRPDLLGPDDWTPTAAGHSWLLYVLLGGAAVAFMEAVRQARHIGSNWQFGVYLMAVAVEAAFFYAVLGCHVRDLGLIRYTLLTLYFPIGLLVLFLSAKPPIWSRALVLGIVVLWGACSMVDNGRFLAAYLHRPPGSPARDLVTYLESQGVRYGRGTYWIAYQLDFLSQERLTFSSLEKVRIAEYQRIADEHAQQTVHIMPNRGWPNRPCEVGVTFRLWCLEYLDRATHVAR